ncbi:MAG: glycosyl hydrolase family 28-related protein, partial [Chitinispirillia bacterium]
MVYSDNYLPDERKGDWFKAGYLRFHADKIKISRVNNIIEYGATNDGKDKNDNNKKSILKAINDTCHSDFTLIFFPEGTYRITSEIMIEYRSRIIIRGAGSEKTRLLFHLNNEDRKQSICIKKSSHIGVENLSITRLDSSDFGNNFLIQATDCWLSGIESVKAVSSHVFIHSGKNIDIRGCYIHHAWNYGIGGHGYGIDMGEGTSYCLIEDNIFKHLRHSVILSNGPHSNVIGYNFSTEPFTTEKYFGISDWPSDLCLHGHPDESLPGPSKNL